MRNAVLIALCLLALCACSEDKYPGFSVTESDLYYRLDALGDLERSPTVGDYLTLNLACATEDSVYFSSEESLTEGRLTWLMDSVESTGGFREALGMLKEGDSASFMISTEHFYTNFLNQQVPDFVKGVSRIEVRTRLVQIQNEAEMEAFQVARRDALLRLEVEEQAALVRYVDYQKIDSSAYYHGIWVVKTQETESTLAELNRHVQVSYQGSFLDGHVFESTQARGAPLDFTIGHPDIVIKGLEMGIKQMRAGEIARIIIPSQLAFGEKGVPGIVPPFTTVVYDVELLNVE